MGMDHPTRAVVIDHQQRIPGVCISLPPVRAARSHPVSLQTIRQQRDRITVCQQAVPDLPRRQATFDIMLCPAGAAADFFVLTAPVVSDATLKTL